MLVSGTERSAHDHAAVSYLCALNPDVRGAAEGCVLEAVAMLLLLPFMLPLPLRLGRD